MLQALNREAAMTQEKLEEALLLASVKLDTLTHSLRERELSSDGVQKQICEETDAIEYPLFPLHCTNYCLQRFDICLASWKMPTRKSCVHYE